MFNYGLSRLIIMLFGYTVPPFNGWYCNFIDWMNWFVNDEIWSGYFNSYLSMDRENKNIPYFQGYFVPYFMYNNIRVISVLYEIYYGKYSLMTIDLRFTVVHVKLNYPQFLIILFLLNTFRHCINNSGRLLHKCNAN